MDSMNKEVKKRHIKRLKKGKCTIELGISLSDITDTYERISDHCSNIAVSVIQVDEDDMESHNYRKELKENEVWFEKNYSDIQSKYVLP